MSMDGDQDEMASDSGKTISQHVAEWAKHQAATTVLLTLVLCFIGYAAIYHVPMVFDRVDKNYQSIADKHEKTITSILSEHSKDREYWNRDRDAANQIIIRDMIKRGIAIDPVGGAAQ